MPVPPAGPSGSEAADFKEILEPRPGDWPTYHGRLHGNRHSALSQITASNVGRLSLAWTHSVRGFDNEMTPLVLDGIMYITGWNQLFALDATTGRVTVLGEDMLRHRYRVLGRMNFSSPYVDLPLRLTVRQNLRVDGGVYGLRGAALREREAAMTRKEKPRRTTPTGPPAPRGSQYKSTPVATAAPTSRYRSAAVANGSESRQITRMKRRKTMLTSTGETAFYRSHPRASESGLRNVCNAFAAAARWRAVSSRSSMAVK